MSNQLAGLPTYYTLVNGAFVPVALGPGQLPYGPVPYYVYSNGAYVPVAQPMAYVPQPHFYGPVPAAQPQPHLQPQLQPQLQSYMYQRPQVPQYEHSVSVEKGGMPPPYCPSQPQQSTQPDQPACIPPPLPMNNAYVMVCAIDFGTTYSGYVCSWTKEYKEDKLKMFCRTWKGAHGRTEKTPTVALFDPDMNFKFFGHEAETEYANLQPPERKKWYLFQQFKMKLYEAEDLSLEATLRPFNRNDKKLAVDVIAAILKYLRADVLENAKSKNSNTSPDSDKIRWILTVPAIWSDKAKIFMRTAAEKAGIDKDNLSLALEPEAAALYCRHLNPASTSQGQDIPNTRPLGLERKFMVADLGGEILYITYLDWIDYDQITVGGGTADITVYQQSEGGFLQELHTPTGGHWGGTTVDEAFHKMLFAIFGAEVIHIAKEEHPGEMLSLQHNFENAKREYIPGKKEKVHVKIPAILGSTLKESTGQDINEYMKDIGPSGEGVSFLADKMSISDQRFERLFSTSLGNMIQHLDDLMQHDNIMPLDAVVLVGGYSEAKIIRKQLESYFSATRFISPPDPSMAVMKGAALFGHEPLAIASRVCKYTYGIAITVPFVDGKHDDKKKKKIGNEIVCDDVFDIHLKKGTHVSIGSQHVVKELRAPINHNEIFVEVYASPKECPKYVTEENCTLLGSAHVTLSDDITRDDPVYVKIIYAGTELEVQVIEGRTRKTSRAKVKFVG